MYELFTIYLLIGGILNSFNETFKKQKIKKIEYVI